MEFIATLTGIGLSVLIVSVLFIVSDTLFKKPKNRRLEEPFPEEREDIQPGNMVTLLGDTWTKEEQKELFVVDNVREIPKGNLYRLNSTDPLDYKNYLAWSHQIILIPFPNSGKKVSNDEAMF